MAGDTFIDSSLNGTSSFTATLSSRNARVSLDATLESSSNFFGGTWSVVPSPPAATSYYDNVEVQIWNKDGTQLLAIVHQRHSVRWQDELNSPGTGSFTVPVTIGDAVAQHIEVLNIVKFMLYGKVIFGFRIDRVRTNIVGGNDYQDREWVVSGIGLLGLLDDAIVYPEYGFQRVYADQRLFSFAAKEGLWYIPSEWSQPIGLPQASGGNFVPYWANSPEGWIDTQAQWIWHTDPRNQAEPGGFWARSKFSITGNKKLVFMMSADNSAVLYLNGRVILMTDQLGVLNFKKVYEYSAELDEGEHLLALSAANATIGNTFMEPATPNWVRPAYSYDSNRPYVGRGYRDGSQPYVLSSGGIRYNGTTRYGSHAFDSSTSTYWLSVGNNPGWSSAYEWVEGSFTSQKVRAVKVSVIGGPYEMYISLRNWTGSGGAWKGSQRVPYRARSVDSGAAIPYLKKVTVGHDATVVVNVPETVANRLRITLKATWNSGLNQYKYRAAVRYVVISNNYGTSTESSSNHAGVLVSVHEVDGEGNPSTTVVHRTQGPGWVGRGEPAPCWKPQQIVLQLMEEARDRAVLGLSVLGVGGFTSTHDSHNKKWETQCLDLQLRIGDSMLRSVQSMVERTEIDFWVDPRTMMLMAYNKRGIDRTTGEGSLTFFPGGNLQSLSAERNRPAYTMLVGKTEYGWVEVADPAVEINGTRIEKSASLGNEITFEQGLATAGEMVRQNSEGLTDVTGTLNNSTGARAYIDYDVGDYVNVVDDLTGKISKYRVMALTISESPDGTLQVRPEFSYEEQRSDELTPVDVQEGESFTGPQVVFDSLSPSLITPDGSETAFLTAHVDPIPENGGFVQWFRDTPDGDVLEGQTVLDDAGYTRFRTDLAGTWWCQYIGSAIEDDPGPISTSTFALQHRTYVEKTVVVSNKEWSANYSGMKDGERSYYGEITQLGPNPSTLHQGMATGPSEGSEIGVVTFSYGDMDQVPDTAVRLGVKDCTVSYTVAETAGGAQVPVAIGAHTADPDNPAAEVVDTIDFASGSLPAGFTASGASVTVVPFDAYTGASINPDYMVKIYGEEIDNSVNWFEMDLTPYSGLVLSGIRFWHRASSEGGYDYGRQLYNGGFPSDENPVSGDGSWQSWTIAVPEGSTPASLRWQYEKDSSVSSRDDSYYVAMIEVLAIPTGTTAVPAGISQMIQGFRPRLQELYQAPGSYRVAIPDEIVVGMMTGTYGGLVFGPVGNNYDQFVHEWHLSTDAVSPPSQGEMLYDDQTVPRIRVHRVDHNGNNREGQLSLLGIGDTIHGPFGRWIIRSVDKAPTGPEPWFEIGLTDEGSDPSFDEVFGFTFRAAQQSDAAEQYAKITTSSVEIEATVSYWN
jgi:hypothetical protein